MPIYRLQSQEFHPHGLHRDGFRLKSWLWKRTGPSFSTVTASSISMRATPTELRISASSTVPPAPSAGPSGGLQGLGGDQSGGIGLGYYDHADVRSFHAHMQAVLEREAAIITDIAYCPHHPRSPDPGQRPTCRKPSPEMLLTLASRHAIDLTTSAMIGDRIPMSQPAQLQGRMPFCLMAAILIR